ncbi:MAG: hypothetical protein LBC73_06185 [Oscillospiraceae bacterium]|jgi:hypothetical protein|nr:hypothetical protein [Oscillospiraceae bacterium]
MPNIIIDEEFQALLPQLDPLELEGLTQNILEHGCMLPLILWNDILIDGYNRYSICTEYDLPFNTIAIELETRDDALEWMITHQLARRNLTSMQNSIYRGMLYNLEKKSHGGDYWTDRQISRGHNDPSRSSTADKLSDRFNISPRTIKRDAEMAEVVVAIGRVSLDAKQEILLEKTKISRKKLRGLSKASEEEITNIAQSIEDGTFDAKEFQNNATVQETDYNKTNDNIKQSFELNNDYINDLVKSLVAPIVSAANSFGANLHKLNQNSDSSDVKSMLRSYIDDLERLYEGM